MGAGKGGDSQSWDCSVPQSSLSTKLQHSGASAYALHVLLQVKVSNFPFNNLIYSATDRSCSNVVVGFDLQILTGVAFSANNLQNKVSAEYLDLTNTCSLFQPTDVQVKGALILLPLGPALSGSVRQSVFSHSNMEIPNQHGN